MILSSLCWPKLEYIKNDSHLESEIHILINSSIEYFELRELETSFSLLTRAYNKYIFSDLDDLQLKSVILNNTAAVHQMRSEFQEAFKIFETVIEIKENHLPNFVESLAIGYGNLALTLISLGKYFQTKVTVEKVLNMMGREEYENRELLSWIYDIQGIANSNIAKFDDAETNFEQSLKLKSQISKENEIEIVLTSNNLAVLYENFEKRSEAIKILEASFNVLQTDLNTNLYEIEKTSLLCNLNIIKFMLGKESPQFFNNQTEQLLIKVPENDILRARIYINCANFMDEYAPSTKECQIYKSKTLALYHQIFDDLTHPDFVKIYETIGNGMMRNWISDLSYEYLLKSLKIAKQTLGDFHPCTAKVCQRLGILAQREGNFAKKLEYFIEALQIYEKCFGMYSHPQIARIHNNIGFTYTAIHDYRQALKSHISAMKVKSKFHSLCDKKMAINYWNIGMVFRMNFVLEYGISVIQKSRTGYKLLNLQTEDVEVCERNIRTMTEDNAKNKFVHDEL